MSVVYIAPSLKSLASFNASKLLWNASCEFEDIQLDEKNENRDRNWEFRLITYRHKAIKILYTFGKTRNLPKLVKSDLTQNIFFLHEAYHQLFLWKTTYDQDNKISLLKEGELYAPRYFNVCGTFNDYTWAKKFVNNPNYSVIDRFSLASLYWFEDECETLWLELKSLCAIHITSNLDFIANFWRHNLALISHRISQIEYGINTYGTNQENFWRIGFEIATNGGYEHAVYYLWNQMSDRERLSIMENESFFELLSKGIDFPNNHISYFLFCELSEERIVYLSEWTSNNGRYEAWYNRLFTPDAESIYSIIKYIPIEVYPGLLTSLSHRIWRLQSLHDIAMFGKLSMIVNHIEMEFILKSVPNILEIFARRKSFDALHSVMLCLTLEQKDKILLDNLYGGGITAINILTVDGEFDMINDYICLFLIDVDASKRRKIVRKDASGILQRFAESLPLILSCEKETCKEYIRELNTRIDALQELLIFLEEICQKVSKEVSKC